MSVRLLQKLQAHWRYLCLVGLFGLFLTFYVPSLAYTNLVMRQILYSEAGYRDLTLDWDLGLRFRVASPAREARIVGWTRARWLSVHERPDAIGAYLTALEKDAENALMAFELGNLYASVGDAEQALALWQRAGSGRFWAYQAIPASEMGYDALAMEFIDRAQAIAITDPVVLIETADLLFKSGHVERALTTYSKFISGASIRDPRLAHALTQRARANHAIQGDWRLSEEDLLSALAFSPHDIWIQIRLCELYRDVDHLDSALTYCQTAVATAPHSASARYYLGRVLFARQDFEAASSEFQHALDLDPDFGSAQHWLERSLGQP